MAATSKDNLSSSHTKTSGSMPELIGRSAMEDYFPGVLYGKTLANLASQGRGPRAYKIGRRVYYKSEDLMQWIEANSAPILSIDAPL
jgi:hypothetical protein